jgi:hypothetical protein
MVSSANPSQRGRRKDIGSFAIAMPLDSANGTTMVVFFLVGCTLGIIHAYLFLQSK